MNENTLDSCLLHIVQSIKDTGKRQGSEAWLYQAQADGKCDAWVKFARPYLDQIKSAVDTKYILYDALVGWDGSGGLHNLYVGIQLNSHLKKAAVFVFDPWQIDLAKQFYRVGLPFNWSEQRAFRIHGVVMAWEPIAKTLYLPQGLNLPDLKVPPNSSIYDEILIPSVLNQTVHRPNFQKAKALGSPIL